MKYSLDLHLRHAQSQPVADVLAALPTLPDVSLWAEGYEVGGIAHGTLEFPNGYSAGAMVRFNDSTSREDALTAVQAVAGVLTDFAVGTTITLHNCYHDSSGACEVETVYEVVA